MAAFPSYALIINLDDAKNRLARITAALDLEGMAWKRLPAVNGRLASENTVRSVLTPPAYATMLGQEARKECGAIRGSHTRGSVGCSLSWRLALETVKAENKPILVLEDDCVIPKGFSAWLRAALKSVPANADLVYLSWNPHDWPCTEDVKGPCQRIVARLHGTPAIIVYPSAVPKLRTLFPLTLQIDHDLPDRFYVPRKVEVFRLHDGTGKRMISTDNLGGTTTQKH